MLDSNWIHYTVHTNDQDQLMWLNISEDSCSWIFFFFAFWCVQVCRLLLNLATGKVQRCLFLATHNFCVVFVRLIRFIFTLFRDYLFASNYFVRDCFYLLITTSYGWIMNLFFMHLCDDDRMYLALLGVFGAIHYFARNLRAKTALDRNDVWFYWFPWKW